MKGLYKTNWVVKKNNKYFRLNISYTHNTNFNHNQLLIAFAKPNLNQNIYFIYLLTALHSSMNSGNASTSKPKHNKITTLANIFEWVKEGQAS